MTRIPPIPAVHEGLRGLSNRELEVLELVARGCSNEQIAATLGLSIHTVKTHVVRVILKLKVSSRSEAAALLHTSVTRDALAVAAPKLEVLTVRERDVLARIATGADNQRIAAELALSLNTVKRHTSNIFSKLGVRSRVTAAALLHRGAIA